MRLLQNLLLLAGASAAIAASSWNFDDASVLVQSKGEGGPFKDKLSDKKALSKAVPLGSSDSLKIILTATESGKPKRPHQAFLLLQDPDTKLEATFPFSVKETGKAKVEVTYKDLPIPLIRAAKPLRATILLASFGSIQPFGNHVFDLAVNTDPNAVQIPYKAPERYGKLPEINHIFKADPKNPPKIMSLVFTVAVLAAVPVLLGSWLYLEANLAQLPKAFSTAPIAHALFFGSIVSMEGIFFLYYYNWTLFQMLPAAGIVGLVGFLSGSQALSEVQARRVAGER